MVSLRLHHNRQWHRCFCHVEYCLCRRHAHLEFPIHTLNQSWPDTVQQQHELLLVLCGTRQRSGHHHFLVFQHRVMLRPPERLLILICVQLQPLTLCQRIFDSRLCFVIGPVHDSPVHHRWLYNVIWRGCHCHSRSSKQPFQHECWCGCWHCGWEHICVLWIDLLLDPASPPFIHLVGGNSPSWCCFSSHHCKHLCAATIRCAVNHITCHCTPSCWHCCCCCSTTCWHCCSFTCCWCWWCCWWCCWC